MEELRALTKRRLQAIEMINETLEKTVKIVESVGEMNISEILKERCTMMNEGANQIDTIERHGTEMLAIVLIGGTADSDDNKQANVLPSTPSCAARR